jgi:DNA-directed RNA polymerase subunit N (RpoN/RPB10)
MIKYIEVLKKEYEKTNDEEKKFEILSKLRAEKETCRRIITEYKSREERI